MNCGCRRRRRGKGEETSDEVDDEGTRANKVAVAEQEDLALYPVSQVSTGHS